jgi:hypothetical protein
MLKNNTRFLIENLPYLGVMRWQVLEPSTREMLAHAHRWDHAVMVAQELSKQVLPPQSRAPLTQKEIDGSATHRRGFFAVLSQIRSSVFPSTQHIVE